MANDEYRRLLEFIGRRFDAVEAHFAETRRHFDGVAEGLRSQVQLVAEGVSAVDQRLDRFEQKVEAEFDERPPFGSPMRSSSDESRNSRETTPR